MKKVLKQSDCLLVPFQVAAPQEFRELCIQSGLFRKQCSAPEGTIQEFQTYSSH